MDPKEIDARLAQCKAAQAEWAQTSYPQRKSVLNTIMQYLVTHQTEVCRVACRDTGKTMTDACLGEVLVTLDKIGWILKNGPSALSDSARPSPANPLMFYKGGKVTYKPLGLVAAFVSWNYPLHNMMGPIVAGLFTGNAVVVKCSENVIWSSQFFLKIVHTALEAHGFSPDLVQLIVCWPETADYLTSHPLLSHITFIGSRQVAHTVARAAAHSLTPLVMELGGKDPFIVLDGGTLDLIKVSSVIMRGTFQGAGQNCIGIERVIAEPHAYDALVEILSDRVKELTLGSSLDYEIAVDMGSMISDTRFEQLEKLVSDAVAQGATLVCGGHRYTHTKYPKGHYFAPTLLIGVNASMDIAQQELFAPILLLMRASSTSEVIEIANGTIFGLAASVFGSDTRKVAHIADRLQVGNVAIQDFGTFYLTQLPFGGTKASGYGKFGGAEGLRGLCLEKSVSYDKYPFIHTTIPRLLDYPIIDGTRAFRLVEAINRAGFEQGFLSFCRALKKILKAF